MDANTPGIRLTIAANCDNAKMIRFLLDNFPESRGYIAHGICANPKTETESFKLLIKEATKEDLVAAEKEVRTLQNGGDDPHKEKTQNLLETIQRERARRVLKQPQIEL